MEIAIIETGGKQYPVKKGDTIRIEKIAAAKGKEHKEGDKVVFDKVLFVDDGTAAAVGAPYVSAAKVTGTIERIARAPKVTVIHYKQKSRYFKKAGHRQPYFSVKIDALK